VGISAARKVTETKSVRTVMVKCWRIQISFYEIIDIGATKTGTSIVSNESLLEVFTNANAKWTVHKANRRLSTDSSSFALHIPLQGVGTERDPASYNPCAHVAAVISGNHDFRHTTAKA
jgi:hypothetical protein